jgi:hypothetical protein
LPKKASPANGKYLINRKWLHSANMVSVRLSDVEETSEENCGPGRVTHDVVSVIIGLGGFEVVNMMPSPPSKVREAFRVENIDKP